MVISPMLYSILGVSASLFFLDFRQLFNEIISLILEIFTVLLIVFSLSQLFKFQISTEIIDRV